MGSLDGITILITRSAHQSSALRTGLEARGARALELPVIAICPPDSWQMLDTALGSIASYDWIIFTSANAVSAVLERSTACGAPLSLIQSRKIASIGGATSEQLLRAGFRIDFQPCRFVAESFLMELLEKEDMRGRRVLYPRNKAARSLIPDTLQENGALVETIDAYQASLPKPPGETARHLARLLEENSVDVVTLASAQSARNFAELLAMSFRNRGVESPPEALIKDIVIATIGPVTSESARQLFGRVDVEAEPHTVHGLIESLEKHFLLG